MNIGTELLVAVEAVLLGQRFVSKEFSADEYVFPHSVRIRFVI
jgi:hypothetical protein